MRTQKCHYHCYHHTIPDLEEDSSSICPSVSCGVMVESSTSITVQWGSVPCIHQNGDITGYSVQYGVMESGITETVTVNGASTTQTTISGSHVIHYLHIRVAAVNKPTHLENIQTDVMDYPCGIVRDVLIASSLVLSSDRRVHNDPPPSHLSWTSAGAEESVMRWSGRAERHLSGVTDEDT
ncbi:hypothetical protein GBAR_LOCUS1983 [Geodia barretti]|uniref:Fibronectin type-III domain-containing protein n=1 Tax=Geodia barretti TaxID=519541 RepID=A0AA35QY93_GEOBA|nr:hypothetical protein GBAR_LOCUS1983 [Geodia barretti]